MLNNIMIIPPNVNEKFKDMWISQPISHMFNMHSACDTAHVNSVCAFACPLPLWPERVVVCRVLLSSASSGCAKQSFNGILVSRLVLRNDIFGPSKIF